MSKSIKILAIESSCDDTAASVIIDGNICSQALASQLDHAQYGGVIPELASRKHEEAILPVVQEALTQAKVELSELSAIAFTQGPGLLGALIVGTVMAKGLAHALNLPLIAVHHMQAHVLSNFIERPHPTFPFLCLTISGGHTQIVHVEDHLTMTVLGQTKDDAAGEAFDKIGKMLGLDYPAGPAIDRLAQDGQVKFDFPEPEVPGLDFSFSGLKTAVRYFLRDSIHQDEQFVTSNLKDICASVQWKICHILMKKLITASEQTKINSIALAGGVSANTGMRVMLEEEAKKRGWAVCYPSRKHCTDNASMIAITAHYKYLRSEFCAQDVRAFPRMEW